MSDLKILKVRKELLPRGGESRKKFNKRFREENPFDKFMNVNLENRGLRFETEEDLEKAYNEMVKMINADEGIYYQKYRQYEDFSDVLFYNSLSWNIPNTLRFDSTGITFIAFVDYLKSKGIKNIRILNMYSEEVHTVK